MYNRDLLAWMAGFVELSLLRNNGEFHLDDYQRKIILAHVNLVEASHSRSTDLVFRIHSRLYSRRHGQVQRGIFRRGGTKSIRRYDGTASPAPNCATTCRAFSKLGNRKTGATHGTGRASKGYSFFVKQIAPVFLSRYDRSTTSGACF